MPGAPQLSEKIHAVRAIMGGTYDGIRSIMQHMAKAWETPPGTCRDGVSVTRLIYPHSRTYHEVLGL